ncbi:MAG: hypothetical protein OEW79_09430 [Betaproteobacteria bacterium]|nr:hypothetical protein [Betaproteobacteria bacterium]MDH5343036.1 hypothetical protein [Betaproteobacteria bacterium]
MRIAADCRRRAALQDLDTLDADIERVAEQVLVDLTLDFHSRLLRKHLSPQQAVLDHEPDVAGAVGEQVFLVTHVADDGAA